MRQPSKLRAVMLVLLTATLVIATASFAAACPTCKEALAADDPTHQNMVAGYYYSILFMMSMPFLLLTSFSGYMYLEVRRARAKAAKNQAANTVNRPHFLN